MFARAQDGMRLRSGRVCKARTTQVRKLPPVANNLVVRRKAHADGRVGFCIERCSSLNAAYALKFNAAAKRGNLSVLTRWISNAIETAKKDTRACQQLTKEYRLLDAVFAANRTMRNAKALIHARTLKIEAERKLDKSIQWTRQDHPFVESVYFIQQNLNATHVVELMRSQPFFDALMQWSREKNALPLYKLF